MPRVFLVWVLALGAGCTADSDGATAGSSASSSSGSASTATQGSSSPVSTGSSAGTSSTTSADPSSAGASSAGPGAASSSGTTVPTLAEVQPAMQVDGANVWLFAVDDGQAALAMSAETNSAVAMGRWDPAQPQGRIAWQTVADPGDTDAGRRLGLGVGNAHPV